MFLGVLSSLVACGGDAPPAHTPSPPPPSTISAPAEERTAPVPAPAPLPSPPVGGVVARHAVLIVIDTLRADALAAARTPAIDALAAGGDRVERAWSAGTWTVPSVISLLTGMSVRAHGWDLGTGKMGRYPPLPRAPRLAGVLRAAGFGTFGAYSNPYLAEDLGFDEGFDTWMRTSDKALPGRFQAHVAAEWGDGRRHFAYLHLLGPHSPLTPSAEAAARWGVEPQWLTTRLGLEIGAAKRNQEPGVRAAYAAAYHAVIEDTDARIAEVVAALGVHRDETLIVLTSDHGELLGEHDKVGHGTLLWEPLTHVPLLVDRGALPDTMGIAAVPDLITTALGVAHAWPTRVPAATGSQPLVSQREGHLAISPDGRQKGIWMAGALSVYDLEADPGEQSPLQTSAPAGAALTAARAAWEAETPPGRIDAESGAVSLHPDAIAELKALGYLE